MVRDNITTVDVRNVRRGKRWGGCWFVL